MDKNPEKWRILNYRAAIGVFWKQFAQQGGLSGLPWSYNRNDWKFLAQFEYPAFNMAAYKHKEAIFMQKKD